MKITISSIVSALAAMAVVSGFILPNHGGMIPQNHHLISKFEDASSCGTTTAAAFISKFRSNSRLLMSETRTFERREGGRGGRGDGSSYERREFQGRGGGRGGRGGEFLCCVAFVKMFVLFVVCLSCMCGSIAW